MATLMRASRELFRRSPDDRLPDFPALVQHCRRQMDEAAEIWLPPGQLKTSVLDSDRLMLAGGDGAYSMNDWSFSQLCRLAGVTKETVNRLTATTASKVFAETLPRGNKPLQLFAQGESLRSIHPASYTRLYNAQVLDVVGQYATDFQPPPEGFNGATGLYAGEQDMFCFLIDPGGWTEIDGEAYAPGFFVWNSEVGCRSIGIETFWFQAICQNHIVWDATEVVEFTRKHTTNVHESLAAIGRIIEELAAKRDLRRDRFAAVLRQAMETRLGEEVDEVVSLLGEKGIPRKLAKTATELARQEGRFTLFSVVDALTRLSRALVNAGDRTQLDQRIGRLLMLAA